MSMFSKRKDAAVLAVNQSMVHERILQILQIICHMEGVTLVALRQNVVGGILEHLPPTHDTKTVRCLNASTNDHAVIQLSETRLKQVKTRVKKKAHLVTNCLAVNYDALLEYFELSYPTRVDIQVFCGAKVLKRGRNWFEVVLQSEHPEEFTGDVAPTMEAIAMDFLKAVAAEGLSDHKVCWNDTNYVQYDPNEQVVPSEKEEEEDLVSAVEEVFEEETTSKNVSGEEEEEEESSGEEEESSGEEEESSGEEEDDDAVLQDDQSDVVDMQEETTSKTTDVVVDEDATNAQVKELASAEVSPKTVSSKKKTVKKRRNPLETAMVNLTPRSTKRKRKERDFFHNH